MAKITLIGMNNYTDGAIWNGLSCPNGIDKTTLINTIMLTYGEMGTLYADPDMMQLAIKTWSDKNAWSMLKAITAINVSYDPLNNYDRTETRTRSENGTNTGTVRNAGETSESGRRTTSSEVETSTTTETDRDETNENEHKVSAYDSSTYSADNTDDGSATVDETVTGTGTSEASGTDVTTNSGTNSNLRTDNLAHSVSESETVRAYGNIGVTTSQQMLQSELDISLYNIYDTFAGIFAYDLLLMVY